MSGAGWSSEFDASIATPDGGELQTLREAGEYVSNLPAIEQRKQHWQTAAEMLLMAAERGGIVMMAEIAMRRALSQGRPTPTAPQRKPAKNYRVVR
jgi:hypothetical protein